MNFGIRLFAVATAFAMALPAPLSAGVGDLLVAPTRIVLDGSRGTEIVLSNIGDDVATYRVSLVMRRMTPDGGLDEVEQASEREIAARDMILFAPRRVTIAPGEPQTIRIAARAPRGLPDGEYRVHALFRAVPKPRPVTAQAQARGVALELIPIYGVTIPVVVRLGNLQATASIANVALTKNNGKPAISLELARNGDRSIFGDVKVWKAGHKDPIALQRGVAVYTEVGTRKLVIPIEEGAEAAASGPVTVEFVEQTETGPVQMAEVRTVLR